MCMLIRPNEKTSVFQVTGLNILARVGTHIFFLKKKNKKIILCILEGISPFKMHKIIFFTRTPENISRFHQLT